MYRRNIEITAIHEAGHVVMALSKGVPFKKVVLKRDFRINSEGYVHIKHTQPQSDSDIEKLILVYLAGRAAEHLHIKKKKRWENDSDLRSILRLIIDIYYYTDQYSDMDKKERSTFLKEQLDKRWKTALQIMSSQRHLKATHNIAQRLSAEQHLSAAKLRYLWKEL